MTSRDFCYWLQGYFEINSVTDDNLSSEQVQCIRKHLNLVFKHEIDPSAGPPEHQAELNAIHDPKTIEAVEALAKKVEELEKRPPKVVHHHSPPGGGLIRC